MTYQMAWYNRMESRLISISYSENVACQHQRQWVAVSGDPGVRCHLLSVYSHLEYLQCVLTETPQGLQL